MLAQKESLVAIFFSYVDVDGMVCMYMIVYARMSVYVYGWGCGNVPVLSKGRGALYAGMVSVHTNTQHMMMFRPYTSLVSSCQQQTQI